MLWSTVRVSTTKLENCEGEGSGDVGVGGSGRLGGGQRGEEGCVTERDPDLERRRERGIGAGGVLDDLEWDDVGESEDLTRAVPGDLCKGVAVSVEEPEEEV